MSLYLRFLGRLLLAGVVVAIAGGNTIAAAQDDDVVEEERAAPVNNGPQGGLILQAQSFDQTDQLVFGRFGGAQAARGKLDSALQLRIEELERVCGLTEAQKIKLHLAGRGDIKRFYDQVEAVKRKFQRGLNAPNTNIWQEIQPLQLELNAGLFGDDSIFSKTIRRTLSPEQLARFETTEQERSALRFRATVDWFVSHLDKGLGLTEDQRQQFSTLLVKETRPPRKMGQGEYWYLMFQVSRLPESAVAPLLDPPQWRLLSRQFPQAKAMVDRLLRAGVLTDDDVAALIGPGGRAATRQVRPSVLMRKGKGAQPAAKEKE